MIESITIRNFQAHRKLSLSLGPVTAIIGASDVGKSAVLRALRWVLFNRPGGDSFRRSGAKRVSVTIQVDGHTVTRSKGSRNYYKLDGRESVSFGSDVPEEISRILNVYEDNFQGQHDAPFWFAESAGEVGRRLNRIINLGAIDDVASFLGSAVRESALEVELHRRGLQDARAERKRLAFSIEAERRLCKLEYKQRRLTERQHKAVRLTESIRETDQASRTVLAANAALSAGASAVKSGSGWASLAERSESLSNLVSQITKLRKTAKRPVADIRPLETSFLTMFDNDVRHAKLCSLIDEAEFHAERSRQFIRSVQDNTKRLAKLMGKECPLCKRPMEKK